MILANVVEHIGFGLGVLLFMGAPTAGLVANIAGMQRRGLNLKAGLATCLFLFTLLVQGTVVTLSMREAFSEKTQIIILAATAVLNSLSAFLALLGLWEIRRKHRWPRGRRRAIGTIWLNIGILAALGAYFFLTIHPKIYDRIFR